MANENVTMTQEQFENAIRSAFNKGRVWGETYQGWFVPTDSDHFVKQEAAIKSANEVISVIQSIKE